ncbi:FAD-dependent monooxygenase [Salinibacterium sp. G-O1]|uniref:FAD-dependent monooxygenase n=1 Tax=Salinibacterium sp. G-O1 TaxID=3046208 RepID=UPI0024B8A2D3|nr:FAD-dependent monooxygenase [Salinibacterium sp. G-O1]MDJ0335749.1 FAD-dependent monooxygenase [Salinibacterium sp. G-O1]
MSSARTTDVLIVGAGPTGLMLAVVLARLGVDHILVDGKSGPTTESRALGVQARTLEIYEQLGLVDEVLANGTKADAISPGFRKRVFATIPFVILGATFTRYPFMQMFEQNKNEALLGDALRRLGGEVLWNRSLEGLEVAASSVDGADRPVTATLSGGVTVTARYVVGADGASSPVRRMRDIGFEGTTSAHTFYVIDAAEVHGLPDTSINVRLGATDFLLGFPMGQGQDARLVGVVPGELHNSSDAPLRERIAGFGVAWGATRWLSTYQVHHRLAERFRDGPVFLAGDAAHVHSPVGAQGMNTGLQDAHNLACKLADVLQGRADDSYLDRYDAERRPVAKHIIDFTERAFENAITDNRVRRFVVRTLLPVVAPIIAFLMPRVPLGRRVFGYVSQTRIHYPMPPASDARRRRDPVIGRRLPPFDSNHEALRSFTWQVHTYGSVDRASAALVGLPVHAFPTPVGTPLRDGWMYLVRPDGFVAAAGVTAEPLVEALPWHP